MGSNIVLIRVLFFLVLFTSVSYSLDDSLLLKSYLERNGVISFEPVSGGAGYDLIFKLCRKEKPNWFLRIFNKNRSFAKRRVVCDASRFAGEKGWSPVFIWCDPNYLFLITEFVEGETVTSSKIQPCHCDKLAINLRKAHRAMTFDSVKLKSYSMKDRALNRLKEIRRYVAPNIHQILDVLERKIKQARSDSKDRGTLVHGDVKADNMLLSNNSLLLIDWAEAGFSSFYDDLGSAAYSLNLNQNQERCFLKKYLDRTPTPQELDLLRTHRWLAGLNYCLWKTRLKIKKNQKEKNKKISNIKYLDMLRPFL